MMNFVKFSVLSFGLNFLAILIIFYSLSSLIDFFDFRFFISSAHDGLWNFIVQLNAFFVAWVATFLILFNKRHKSHWKALLGFEVIIVMLWYSIDLIASSIIFDRTVIEIWDGNYFYEFKYVLPLVILIAFAIYGVQTFIGKKFLPERYKSSLR